ncbi:MAG: dihydroorotase [Butyrivibrio sp.]|nr:dihydroorotase [Butyrivibrio sp.]
MFCIKNGYVIDPKSGLEGYCDILIKDGKIESITEQGKTFTDGLNNGLSKTEQVEYIDASGKVIAPGLVDVHVHFRDPGFTYKEDIESGAAAAAKGGFTTVVLMANTKPPVDNEETLKLVIEKGKKTGIHVHTCANVSRGMKGQELVDMEALSAAGAVGFTDDGVPILNEDLLREALRKAARLGKPISLHEENPQYIANNGINAGKASEYLGIGGSDRQAEIDMVKRDIEIADEEGTDLSIQHISTKEAVELIRQIKKKSSHIFAEATPHHFTLTQDAVIEHGAMAKMNPPLREEADRQAIIEGLKDGAIDMIATDHAPHSAEEKSRAITEAPSGIIGLETALSLGIRELVEPKYLSMMELIRKMSAAPAEFYHLEAGSIAEGKAADLVIFDMNKKWQVTREGFASKSCNSPFIGEWLPGVIEYTICDGKIVYSRKEE